jgi:hypothetical protein
VIHKVEGVNDPYGRERERQRQSRERVYNMSDFIVHEVLFWRMSEWGR